MSETQAILSKGKEGKALLPELYALRAGLSAVSVEKDKITAKDGKIKDLKDRNVYLKNQAHKTKNNNEYQANERIRNLESDIEEAQSTIKFQTEEISEIKKKSVIVYFLKVILLLLPIAASVVGVIYSGKWMVSNFKNTTYTWFFIPWPNEGGPFFTGVFALILTLLCAAGVIFFTLWFFSCFNSHEFLSPDGVFTKRRDIRNCNDYIAQCNLKIVNSRRQIAAEEAFIKKIESEFKLPEEIGENNKYIETLEEERTQLVLTTNALIKELEKQFKSTVDKRDWKNLDLIIYYFETGRADTRKEALQNVDKELQTGTIANAMGFAAKEISENIRDGLQDLHKDVVYCLGGISKQISAVGQITAAGIQAQAEMQTSQLNALHRIASYTAESSAYSEATYKRMSQLVTSTNLQNALQAKANKTSEQLSKDIGYMRNLSENAEIRRRNGV